mgnify:FL=1
MKKDKKGLKKSTFMEITAIMRSVTALAFDKMQIALAVSIL